MPRKRPRRLELQDISNLMAEMDEMDENENENEKEIRYMWDIKIILYLNSIWRDYFGKKYKNEFLDIDDRVHQEVQDKQIIPTELGEKIEAFKAKYIQLEVL